MDKLSPLGKTNSDMGSHYRTLSEGKHTMSTVSAFSPSNPKNPAFDGVKAFIQRAPRLEVATYSRSYAAITGTKETGIMKRRLFAAMAVLFITAPRLAPAMEISLFPAAEIDQLYNSNVGVSASNRKADWITAELLGGKLEATSPRRKILSQLLDLFLGRRILSQSRSIRSRSLRTGQRHRAPLKRCRRSMCPTPF